MNGLSSTLENGGTDVPHIKQFIGFELGDQFYGLDITTVREIRQWTDTAEMPDQVHYCRGVLDIRGEVVPVYDLQARLGGENINATQSNVVLILSINDRRIGVLVDSVSDIISIRSSELRPVPIGARGIEPGSITNLAAQGDRMIALLDCSVLFDPTAPANLPDGNIAEPMPEAGQYDKPMV